MIKLLSPANGSSVSAVPAKVEEYLTSRGNVASYVGENADLSRPLQTELLFSPPLDADVTVSSAHGECLTVRAHRGRARIFNLRVGEKYTWYVSLGFMRSESFEFKVSDTAPRILYAEGMSNMRDIGGYSVCGGQVRQGMLFRSGEPGRYEKFTEAGKRTVLSELGIRTVADLRGINGECVRTEFSEGDVTCVRLPVGAYGDIFGAEQMRLYRDGFRLLCRRETYPALIHCRDGADRTGTYFFILGALLGIDEGDLVADYELSSFSPCGERSHTSAQFSDFYEKLHSYGKGAETAARNYLLACGLTENELSGICEILTERI